MALNLKNNATQETPETEVKETAPVEAPAEVAAPAGELGSKSDKIVLVAPLGDPSREDVTPRTVNGIEEKIITSTIVGYLFKALEPMDVPSVVWVMTLVRTPCPTRKSAASSTSRLVRPSL